MGHKPVAGMAGKPAPTITLYARDGLPYVRNIDAWYCGIAGLFIHRIPEEPDVFTVSHFSGLRIGRSRFPNVGAACDVLAEVFGNKIDFTNPIDQVRRDPILHLWMGIFMEKSSQVKQNMDGVKRLDLSELVQKRQWEELKRKTGNK